MENTNWFIHKLPDGSCEITQRPRREDDAETWGPFTEQQEALARRVGLIRSGKCKPRAPI
ncbi:MAG: hypothetical protein H7Y22_09075 [Gemmatimonadaceae bacterium]|nr:hypothetical protein [Gloeobacterales cyanobacterium ES-bin-141]